MQILEVKLQISQSFALTSLKFKVKNDHRCKFSNLSNWKEEAWKNQGFNGIRKGPIKMEQTDSYKMLS